MKSIIEIGHCCAGIPQTFADHLNTKHLVFNQSKYRYKANSQIYIKEPRKTNPISILKYLWGAKSILDDYDILHFHVKTLLPNCIDLRYLFPDHEIWLHHHGSEIRGKNVKYARRPDKIFVSTPDLLIDVPDAKWIPNPINLASYKQHPPQRNGSINIIHAPTRRDIKGTSIVIQAMDEIGKNYDINFEIIENKSHEYTIEKMQEADIIIDWINPKYGIYGMVSTEAMALGKPTIASINQDYYQKDCPVITAFDKASLKEAVEELLHSQQKIDGIGEQGRLWVQKHHDVHSVIKELFI